MFKFIADTIIYSWFHLPPETHLAESLHFFVEDVFKIYVLLFVMVYVIAFLRAALDTEVVRHYLQGKNRWFAYFLASLFGAITPFCSCSSIPLFLGFTMARIPLGITMSFLITSPLINEVAVVMLGSLLGWKFTVIYISLGLLAGILSGAFFDWIKAERFLDPLITKAATYASAESQIQSKTISMRQRHEFAKNETVSIFKKIWLWILVGVGLGAGLHGFVPESFVLNHFGKSQWWTVPAIVIFGIPLYSNATSIIPVAEALLLKGLPVGTTIAFMMSVIGASIPEFVMLKRVMQWQLLIILFIWLLCLFTAFGWILNVVY